MRQKITSLFLTSVFWLIGCALKCRYRVKTKGLEKIVSLHRGSHGGILFLPNHVSFCDPLILTTTLWKHFNVRPAVIDNFYKTPIISPVMKILRALSVPNFTEFKNLDKSWEYRRNVEHEIIIGLGKKENFIFYPSGRLKRQGEERLEGCSGAHRIVKNTLQPNVVLVKMTGLWGSSFSCSSTGQPPEFFGELRKGFIDILKNYIFFMPKREVEISFEIAQQGMVNKVERLDFNRSLESWYNVAGSEPLVKVAKTHKRTNPATIEVIKKQQNDIHIHASLLAKVLSELQKMTNRSAMNVSLDEELGADWGLDSIEIAHLIAACGKLKTENFNTMEIKKIRDIFPLLEDEKVIEKKLL